MTNNTQSTSTTQYVKGSLYIFNTLLLGCHIFFLIFFKIIGADFLYYFNYLSIATYIAIYFLIKFGTPPENGFINKSVASIIYAEMYLHMVVATICLGYEFGFLQYCFSTATSIIYVPYFFSREKRINKKAGALSLGIIVTYVLLRTWTYQYPPVYQINADIAKVFYMGNSLITLSTTYLMTHIFITTVFKQEDTLISIADYDALTGLRNRRAMLQVLDRFKNECTKKKKLLCVAILDIDFFKKVNDTYGHDAGDAVLKDLADLLLKRESEVPGFRCARWGGEEFVLTYLTNADGKEEIVKELEYIRKCVEEKSVEYNGMTIRHTMTIGAAFYDGTGDADTLITEADQRLYKGKETSRNCVVWE